jgi:hypothetical protein
VPASNFGDMFWETTDCSGPGLIAASPESFHPGYVCGVHDAEGSRIDFVVPDGVDIAPGEFQSWIDPNLGSCLNFEDGIFPNNAPTMFLRQDEVQQITAPPFTGVLTMQQH